jgi:CheY-like chemotaxis protein
MDETNKKSNPKHKAKILVVDDEAVIRALERHVLEELGHEVIEAENAEQAIQLAREHRPDLILLDIMMSGMNGIQACQILRQDKRTAEIRIIVVSGLDARQALEESIIAGADDFLAKPIDHTELAVRARSMLRVRNIHDDERRTEKYINSLQALRSK